MAGIVIAAVIAVLARGLAVTIAPRGRKKPTLVGGVGDPAGHAVLIALAGIMS
jgi:hypothetical protein